VSDYQQQPGSSTWVPDWEPNLSSGPNLQLVPLARETQEFLSIYRQFISTQRANIIKIEKVYNHRLKSLYDLELQQIKQKNNNDPSIQYVKLLFHGTSKTEPDQIYNGEKGFMMQFAAEGMWGRGTYFAEKSSYSHAYAFVQGNMRQMFLTEVIVGDSYYCASDRSLRVPPEKKNRRSAVGLAVERYDSVSGETGGSKVYIVYDNNKAYPTYLISYN